MKRAMMIRVTVQTWDGYILGQVIFDIENIPFDFEWFNREYILYVASYEEQ